MAKNNPPTKNAPPAAPAPAAAPRAPARSANVDVSAGPDAGIQLPPALSNLLVTLRDDRKNLLKEKPVTDEATTKFLAHFLYPRLIESIEILGVGLTETYTVASQAFTETGRMRDYVDRKVEEAVDDQDGITPVADEDLDTLRQSLAALGLLLQAKAPEDGEIQLAFNLVIESFTAIAGDGAVVVDGDDDDGDSDDEDDEDGLEDGEGDDGDDDGGEDDDGGPSGGALNGGHA
jgi:hypothetical protein